VARFARAAARYLSPNPQLPPRGESSAASTNMARPPRPYRTGCDWCELSASLTRGISLAGLAPGDILPACQPRQVLPIFIRPGDGPAGAVNLSHRTSKYFSNLAISLIRKRLLPTGPPAKTSQNPAS